MVDRDITDEISTLEPTFEVNITSPNAGDVIEGQVVIIKGTAWAIWDGGPTSLTEVAPPINRKPVKLTISITGAESNIQNNINGSWEARFELGYDGPKDIKVIAQHNTFTHTLTRKISVLYTQKPELIIDDPGYDEEVAADDTGIVRISGTVNSLYGISSVKYRLGSTYFNVSVDEQSGKRWVWHQNIPATPYGRKTVFFKAEDTYGNLKNHRLRFTTVKLITRWPENYINTLLPVNNKDEYVGKKDWSILKDLTYGHYYYRNRNMSLAGFHYHACATEFDKIWENSLGNDRPRLREVAIAIVEKVNQLAVSIIEDGDPDKINDYDLYINSNTPHSLSALLSRADDTDLPHIYRYHYLRRFIIPYNLSLIAKENYRFRQALLHLFYIYHVPHFSVATSSDAVVDAFYFGVNKGIAYGLSGLDDQLLNHFASFPDVPEARKGELRQEEKKAIKLAVASVYYEWGEYLYKQENSEVAVSKYYQVIRMYYDEWYSDIGSNTGHVKSINPKIRELLSRVHSRLSSLANGYNYIGYLDNYIPKLDYQFLRENTLYYVNQAKSYDREVLSFFQSAENASEQGLILSNRETLSKLNQQVTRKQIDIVDQNHYIATLNKQQTATSLRNLDAQIIEFERNHPFAAVSRVLPEHDPSFREDHDLFSGTISVWSEVGGYVGSIFGFSTSGPIQFKEKEALFHQMLRELVELQQANAIAQEEVERLVIEQALARLNNDIADREAENVQELIRFSQNKTVSEEYWYKLANELRFTATTYLYYSITLAWLTERAYAAEYQDNLDVIRFDYRQTDDGLAADRLLLDLDMIEYRRLTNARNKSVNFQYTVSLRNTNVFALQNIKQSGRCEFAITNNDLDTWFPGTYLRRIQNVDVNIMALSSQSDVKGTLTKLPISTKRVKWSGQDDPDRGIFADWIQHTLSPYKFLVSTDPEETMVLPVARDQASKLNIKRSDNQVPFYNFSAAGKWALDLPISANTFNYDTLYDVMLTLDIEGFYDANLKEIINLERRKLAALGEGVTGAYRNFSLKMNFPDILYTTLNQSTSNSEAKITRLFPLKIEREYFPPNQLKHKLTELWVIFYLDNKATRVNIKLTSQNYNPDNTITINDGVVTIESGSIYDLKWFPNLSNDEAFSWYPLKANEQPCAMMTDALGSLGFIPYDLWILRIDAADNPDLTNEEGIEFDEDKLARITDVVLDIAYQYMTSDTRQSPVYAWAHFYDNLENNQNNRIIISLVNSLNELEQIDFEITSQSFNEPDWVLSNGRLIHHQSEMGISGSIFTPSEYDFFPGDDQWNLRFGGKIEGIYPLVMNIQSGEDGVNKLTITVRRKTLLGHTFNIKIDKTIAGVTEALYQEDDVAIDNSEFYFEVKKENASDGKCSWYINSREIFTSTELDKQYLESLSGFQLSSVGYVEIDNILINKII